MARAFWGLKQYDQSHQALTATLELFPTNWNALLLRGGIYELQNKPELMLADYEAAMKLGSNTAFGELARIYSGLAPAHLAYKNEEKARKLCNRGGQLGIPEAALCLATN